MEIHTQNLLTFALQENRLQSNFIVIEAAIKALQEQIKKLGEQQDTIIQNSTRNQIKIDNLFVLSSKQNGMIHAQKSWIQQINSQFNAFDQPVSMGEHDHLEFNLVENNETKKDLQMEAAIIKRLSTEKSQKEEVQMIKPNVEVKKINNNQSRNAFEKIFANLKERLNALERDSEEKEKLLEEISVYIKGKKNKENQHHPHHRKISKQMLKPINISKKDLLNLSKNIMGKQNEGQEGMTSSKSINRLATQGHESEGIASSIDLGNQMDEIMASVVKQMDKLKESFSQKTRIMDIHIKQNDKKVQNIQKNMDILQRSHDLLKYDFDRTSTSFSKTRTTNETQETKHRREGELNDTRVTNKQYYQQKLVELFNQMDFIKNQYLDIQAKIQKEENDETEGEKGDRKSRILHKLIHHKKEQNDQSHKKQISVCRRELKKLREQFQQFAFGVNTGSNEVKTYIIKPNQTKQDWKSLSTKIYKLKMQLQAGVRDLQGKIVTNNDMVVVLNQLQVGIQECRIIAKKKLQITDFQKAFKRLQGRLNNFIMQVYEKDGIQTEMDAAMAKQPWFCLSCDNQLKNYSGKLQKNSPPNEKLIGRKVNPQSHMVRRNQNGRLPSVIK